jgi:hypothetical protein
MCSSLRRKKKKTYSPLVAAGLRCQNLRGDVVMRTHHLMLLQRELVVLKYYKTST